MVTGMFQSIKDLNNLTKQMSLSGEPGVEVCITYKHQDFHILYTLIRKTISMDGVLHVNSPKHIKQIAFSYDWDGVIYVSAYESSALLYDDIVYDSCDIINEYKELVTVLKLVC